MHKLARLLGKISTSTQSAQAADKNSPARVGFCCLFITLLLLNVIAAFGQRPQYTDNNSDRSLHGAGRVNPSTLGMEIDIPLGSYPGRGINVPVSLSYSSKVWQMDYAGLTEDGAKNCKSLSNPKYSQQSASGWTTSLAVPYVEYAGRDNIFDGHGFPYDPLNYVPAPCADNDIDYSGRAYVRRIVIHLPGGETHELRVDDTVHDYSMPGMDCNIYTGANCGSDDPHVQANWNYTFYATDGSNLIYKENSNAGTYTLLMPDGSHYEFVNSLSWLNDSTIRPASRFTDRNGNYTSYAAGVWTDTLGRTLTAPIGLQAPSSPTADESPQIYTLPGMTGSYKFHWKRLRGDTPQSPLYYGNKRQATGNTTEWETITDEFLFASELDSYIPAGSSPFNPIVLTRIDLPTGQSYKFSYNRYGIIEKIQYPTGGEEDFVYNQVAPLSYTEPGDVSAKANLGVTDRKIYPTAGQSANYEWTYSAEQVAPAGYKVSVTNPDQTLSERFLHQGNGFCGSGCTAGSFGFDNGLAGMPYEELAYSAPDSSQNRKLLSRSLTNWTKTYFSVNYGTTADWHPRKTYEQNFVYDESGNGVSASTKYEYENESGLSQRETPVLVNKVTQYAFVAVSPSTARPAPGETPDPLPTPVPTPVPSSLTPIRISETTYLINDTVNYPTPADRDAYKNQNMVGLVTVSKVKNGAGIPVSQSEMKYDDANYSPNVGRGNPTTLRVWDSTKGLVTDANAYISTHAKFDTYGNQTEATDAKGNTTVTTYDTVYQAYPVKVTTAIPDPNPSGDPGGVAHGSQSAFETTATFNTTTGLPLTTTDANGQTTTMEYDPVTLRPKKVTPPSGAGTAETFYHDEPNNYWVKNKTQIDANKWAESITYFDGLGRAIKSEQIDSQGNIFVEKEFDADGRVLRVTNPYRTGETKYWTTNVYDGASRVREVVLPDASTVKTDYGISVSAPVGITKQITDQAGRKRIGITDVLGRMIRVIEDPDNSNLPTDYTFDTMGNLRKTEQGVQFRYFSYDSLGRLLRAKQPEQDVNTNLALDNPDAVTGNNAWTVKYAYDNNGNIISTTDAKNATVTATYDKFNRLIFRNYSDSTMPDVDFYYDGTGLGLSSIPDSFKGKTTKVTSSISETRYTSFDNLGRLLASEQRTTADQRSGTQPAYTSSYTYNLSGALVTETYPSTRVVTYQFDQDGALAGVTGQKPNSTAKLYLSDISYNSAGAIEKMRLGNGRWESASYNERMQVKQIALGNSNTDKSLLKLDYSYTTTPTTTDNNGSLREQKISYAGLANQITQAYDYDNLNRLHSATETSNTSQQSWKQTFTYDRYGNRRFDTASGNTTTPNLSTATKVTNPEINISDNRFKKDQDNDSITDYDYDANGNLTLDAENKRFVYDAENHQTKFFLQTNSTQTPDSTYEYDGMGRRVRKTGGQTETIFVYNGGGKLVAEYSTQISNTPQVSYLTSDHLGSPRIITDGGGAVIARHDYMAFGNDVTESIGAVGGRATAQGYNAPEDVRQGYTGYEKDDESKLDYAQARYYNSAHGRFTSVDPLTASATIKNPQTFNRYSYVLNSPYKFSDPLGLMPSGGNPDRGKPEYNQKLADFLDGKMIPASDERATYQPEQTPAVTQTSGGRNSNEAHGSEAQGAPTTAQPELPPSPTPDNDKPGDENVGIEVIVWDGTSYKDSVFSSEGHVSYVIDGISYSFDSHGYHLEDPGEYIKKRRETSGGTGYSLDFGSKELNDKFKDSIKNAYKNPDGSIQWWTPTNNCAYAFKAAMISMAGQLGVNPPDNNTIRPATHKEYIENQLNKYITVFTPYPFIKGNGGGSKK